MAFTLAFTVARMTVFFSFDGLLFLFIFFGRNISQTLFSDQLILTECELQVSFAFSRHNFVGSLRKVTISSDITKCQVARVILQNHFILFLSLPMITLEHILSFVFNILVSVKLHRPLLKRVWDFVLFVDSLNVAIH